MNPKARAIWCPGRDGAGCKNIIALWDAALGLWRIALDREGRPIQRYGTPNIPEFRCGKCGWEGNADEARDRQLSLGVRVAA